MLNYKLFEHLRGDIYGGLTAAVVALPLALAFGVASGLGALAGLYGAILVGFFAAIFGGTATQVSGPTGPMTVVMAALVTQFNGHLDIAFTVVMLGGLFQILFGVFKLGRYINLVPYSVISGFMSGIGCIIIILQLGPLVGNEMPVGNMLVKLTHLPEVLATPNYHALVLGLLALAIMCFTPTAIRRLLPPPLLALIIGTAAGFFYFTDASVIGPIPSGLPDFHWPSFSLSNFPIMLRLSLMLAFLGSIDSLLTSLIADSITRSQHHPDRELIGQGLGNMVAGIFGGIPGAGATMRTVVNVRAGGRTQLSGALHSLVLLGIVMGFGDLAEHIPLAVLAGILLKVGIDIIDWRYLKRLTHAPRAGIVIMLITLLLTVATDLVTAVAVGITIASLLFVKRMAETSSSNTRLVSNPAHSSDLSVEEAAILEKANGRIVVFHPDGPLSFGSAKDLSRMLLSSKEQDVLILELSEVPFIDSSAAIALEDVILVSQQNQDTVVICGMNKKVNKTLKKIGVLKLIASDHIVENRDEALKLAGAIINS
ncbi:MAG: SulP family inorganic anion transporter [Gammaproteobacteria bacterium]|nr:SulP family inorganic anion transporter [Gammaproteobacteria bacterium]